MIMDPTGELDQHGSPVIRAVDGRKRVVGELDFFADKGVDLVKATSQGHVDHDEAEDHHQDQTARDRGALQEMQLDVNVCNILTCFYFYLLLFIFFSF